MKTQSLLGALIGAGNVTPFHMRAWENVPQAEIVAIVDPNMEAAIERGDEYGIPRPNIHPSFEALLASGMSPDFVDIATTPDTHPALVKLASENGIPITCQKPFAYTLKEARQMIRGCEQAAVLLNINENWRWRPWYREIKTRLDGNEIGKPVYASFFIHTDFWVRPENQSRLRKRPHGTLFEWGIHHIDIMRFLFGEVASVYARTHCRFDEIPDIDQMALVVLNFHSGVIAYLDLSAASFSVRGNVSRNGPMVEDMRIEGDRGTIELLPDQGRGDRLRVVTGIKNVERPAYEETPESAYQASYTAAHQHFIDCLLSSHPTETHAQDNLKTLAVTLAAYHSAKTNQVVTIETYERLDA